MKDILISFIEHGLWPTAVITGALLLFKYYRREISGLISSLSELKIGKFTLSIKTAASKAGAAVLYENLAALNNQQLHLFLVIGGDGGDTTTYTNKLPQELQERAFQRLSDLGLIEYKKEYSEEHKKEVWKFGNTEKGVALHKIIMDELYENLVVQPQKRISNKGG